MLTVALCQRSVVTYILQWVGLLPYSCCVGCLSSCSLIERAANQNQVPKKCHDEFTHARSRRGNAWRCAKIAGSVRKQVVSLRVYCGHFVRVLRELCVKMRVQRANSAQTRLHAMITRRCVPQKWHAFPRSIACHCGDKMRASVNVALSVKLWMALIWLLSACWKNCDVV